MWLKNFLRSLTSTSSRRRRQVRHPRSARLCLEAIEDRLVPSAYSLVQLPLYPLDVNSHGQVVGFIPNEFGQIDQAALWHDGTLINLGLGHRGAANAINDAGQVVGFGFLITPEDTDGDGAPDRWFRDDNHDGLNDLMTALPGEAVDINNSGHVLIRMSGGRGGLCQNGQVIDLGSVLPDKLNDAGQVVGLSFSSSFAFLLTPKDTNEDGTPDLWYRDADNNGTNDLIVELGQWSSRASAINSGGQVVGVDGYFSFLWTPTEPNGTSGSLEYLGRVGMDYFDFLPTDINGSGQVIGMEGGSVSGSEPSEFPGAGSAAKLWQNGEMYYLADLLPADSGWSSLYSAAAISENGWIVGTTTGSLTLSDGFVMIPTGGGIGPHIRVSDATVVEGNTGTTPATSTVTLSAASNQTITVDYATRNGTATAGSDYQAATGTLTFAPGETSKTITVLVDGDRVAEPNETFLVNLSNPTNAAIADGQGVGNILDDEPRISITDMSKTEGKKNQTTVFTFTVTLLAAYDEPVTVSYRTVNGTATTAGRDYVAKTGTLTFAPGETTKTISIEVKGDTRKEANETFYVDLFGLSSNALFTKNRGLGTIVNDD